MWEKGWRDQVWSALDGEWDLVVIGGGITGAGILREAVRFGLRTLLVEAGDFAAGTSSRSSKLVHGGLRYLKNGQLRLTYHSVRERERLLEEGRGLVTPLGFLLPSYRRDTLPGWVFGLGLVLYDVLAGKWGHRRYDAYDIQELCPPLCEEDLLGGYRYFDAQTDDARLVLRLIREAVRDNGMAINYAPVRQLLRSHSGKVCGVVLCDASPEGSLRTAEVKARLVINATGAWADQLRVQIGAPGRLRKLRGSHLIFPAGRLPLSRAVSLMHPQDGRPVFALPWEGVTLVGTTDVDHTAAMDRDPAISAAEIDYLLLAMQKAFPEQELALQDVQATFSGVRPVIDTGKADPSKESREHVLWCEEGLLTVAGGKLTTFRLMAQDALRQACALIPGLTGKKLKDGLNGRLLDPAPPEDLPDSGLSRAARLRLLGRYGQDAPAVAGAARPGELDRVAGSPSRWAELRWAARAEGVVHLEDLLLRRVRLGLQLPEGGLPLLERIRTVVQPELGWDDGRWQLEAQNYAKLWKQCYHLPG